MSAVLCGSVLHQNFPSVDKFFLRFGGPDLDPAISIWWGVRSPTGIPQIHIHSRCDRENTPRDLAMNESLCPHHCVAPAMASAGNGPEVEEDDRGGSQLRRAGSTYLKFIERFASFCQRSDAISSSDDSDSAAPLGRGTGRPPSGRSWVSGRLGRSKKNPDQVKAQLSYH